MKRPRVYIAGHRGMVGAALARRFADDAEILTRSRAELDLTRQEPVEDFFAAEKPDLAIIAAAKVGGIHANRTYPAEFLHENLAIAANCVHAAWKAGTKRLLFLGSSCIYPKHAPQPMPEECLLTSPLETTNEAYAVAKIAGLKLCQHYRHQYGALFHSAMPTNLYGPRDNYHPENSHVLPALLRRFHEAKESGAEEVVVWGTGTPRREFLHVDDLADACFHLVGIDDPPDWINVGTGTDVTIRELAETVREVVGFAGKLVFDASKPDGTPRKLLDVSRMEALGWKAKIGLREGMEGAYQNFLRERESEAARL